MHRYTQQDIDNARSAATALLQSLEIAQRAVDAGRDTLTEEEMAEVKQLIDNSGLTDMMSQMLTETLGELDEVLDDDTSGLDVPQLAVKALDQFSQLINLVEDWAKTTYDTAREELETLVKITDDSIRSAKNWASFTTAIQRDQVENSDKWRGGAREMFDMPESMVDPKMVNYDDDEPKFDMAAMLDAAMRQLGIGGDAVDPVTGASFDEADIPENATGIRLDVPPIEEINWYGESAWKSTVITGLGRGAMKSHNARRDDDTDLLTLDVILVPAFEQDAPNLEPDEQAALRAALSGLAAVVGARMVVEFAHQWMHDTLDHNHMHEHAEPAHEWLVDTMSMLEQAENLMLKKLRPVYVSSVAIIIQNTVTVQVFD